MITPEVPEADCPIAVLRTSLSEIIEVQEQAYHTGHDHIAFNNSSLEYWTTRATIREATIVAGRLGEALMEGADYWDALLFISTDVFEAKRRNENA